MLGLEPLEDALPAEEVAARRAGRVLPLVPAEGALAGGWEQRRVGRRAHLNAILL